MVLTLYLCERFETATARLCSCFVVVSMRGLPVTGPATDSGLPLSGADQVPLTLSIRVAMSDSLCPAGLFWPQSFYSEHFSSISTL